MHNKINEHKSIVKFALVGCGRISANHLSAIAAFPDSAKLVAVCDINHDATIAIQAKYPVAIYSDLTDMLSAGGFDAVIITTPSGLHASQTIQCAKAGYNVITEKPMATNFADGISMVKGCDSSGVKLFVVKQNRYNSTIKLLKEAIDSGRFGRIYNVNCNVFWTRPQEYYDSAPWRGTWEFDGGAFMNQASHYVDLLQWLVGPVESVQSYIATLDRKIEVEDSGVAALKWRSGALGTINVTMLTYPKNLEGSITIIGEFGTVKVGGVALNEIEHWEFAKKDSTDEALTNAGYATSSVYGFGHQLYYDNVIRVLQGEDLAYVDGREGLKSLELLEAIYRSAREGKKIDLPLDVDRS